MLERVAALTAMFLVLHTLGAQLDSEHIWALWSILALALIIEFLAYRKGVVQGMDMYRQLPEAQRREIDRILKDEQQ